MCQTKLFQPITLGRVELQHRVVMAPLTRFRADENHVPLPMSVDCYTQRASSPGTLIIAEATHISPRHCGGPHTTGIWNNVQIEGWRSVIKSVHAKGCVIYCQLIAPGRGGHLDGYPLYGPSAIVVGPGSPLPQEMSEDDTLNYIEDFKVAARNAMEAGFDGIELHGANGYLIDQFIQDVSNTRTDKWGGTPENRSRFIVELTKAVAFAIGSDRVGVRLSPWSTYQGMKMRVAAAEKQFSDVIRRLKQSNIAYLYLIESRVINHIDTEKTKGLEFAFNIWEDQSLILVAGRFKADVAKMAVDEEYKDHDVLVVFGRYFVSTPDLVYRLRHNIEPNPHNRSTFYTPVQAKGYTDYPFSEEYLQSVGSVA
ncbi:hypothetical protein B0J13DRAFT_515434 [Dactylonectria estremocensis]|uniref:NADH:flavin oxidoreductase/NADH oxidase N-terminal domain-containing protein n=1 Tax=Dactylonectria estremocensis TaxID=1079267 RepID=A0A9P9D6Y3_9HYPO|nr:hypothetical protein B0J13DRAFT_515434 [Dactylonectria estremocensis]